MLLDIRNSGFTIVLAEVRFILFLITCLLINHIIQALKMNIFKYKLFFKKDKGPNIRNK